MPILNDIISWVENKPSFWQVAVDRLIRNNELSDSDLHDIKQICKVDFGLSNFSFEATDFEQLRDFAANSTSGDNLILTKIFNTNNINALSPTSVLPFSSSGLTLVYGDNGSGKSSYVSILKHTCKTRGHKPKLNGNLYNPNSFGSDKIADVEYTIDEINYHSVHLSNGEVDDLRLKNVNVFDTFSANHYIDGEDEIAFIPQGLSIVENFAIYLKRIENELIEELASPSMTKFDYLILEIPDDCSAKIFLEKLSSDTTLDELRSEAIWNSTKESRIEELNLEIEKLKATDPKKDLKDNEEKVKRFEIIKNKFQTLENSLTGEFLSEFKEKVNTFIATNEALEQASANAFSDLPIDGVGNNSWKLLWESARKFYNESKNIESFPETKNDSDCPLCLQKLDEEAVKRFINFEEFVKNDIQKSYDQALSEYNLLSVSLLNTSFSFSELEPTIAELGTLILDYDVKHSVYLEALSEHRQYLLELINSKIEIEMIDSPEMIHTPKTLIIALTKKLTEINEKLKTQSITEDLKPLSKELNQLIGEKKLFNHKGKLGREIYRQKKVNLLNSCIGKCSTRQVTTLSNDLATKYISQNLKQNFKTELSKLGFKNIKIETETKGQRGKQYHYLRLDEQNTNNISLKDVLSEGEHRCISLATFFSELSISEHKSAIIFDDPVSSLDHKWRHKISKRIVEESKERQLIVFTHDITFLLMIQEHAKKLDCDLDIKSLTRKKRETGLIASNPPWDALAVGKRIGLLKDAYQKLAKIERTETEEVYRENAKTLYGKLRETWERFVEEVFLNGVIQRFGREIQTQRLSKVVDLSAEDYNIVELNMSKCSTYFTGHDTAGTLIEEMPDSSEFLSDLTVLENLIIEIRKRRK